MTEPLSSGQEASPGAIDDPADARPSTRDDDNSNTSSKPSSAPEPLVGATEIEESPTSETDAGSFSKRHVSELATGFKISPESLEIRRRDAGFLFFYHDT